MLLYLLEALELVVRDEQRPLYNRAFAWYRLFRHWGALRWDDTQALPPGKLERRSRGVFGLLERTKTSGPGTSLTVLPVFVSEDAYIRRPWLDVGLLLWTEGPLEFERDFFLPLPSADFQGCLRARALYSDAAGFSRALFGTLRRPDGTAPLSATACRYWTERSDRAGLDGWCMALSVAEPERSFLGRWAAKGSTDTYVRTAARVVENLQLLTARHARASARGGPDFYGEEHILQELRRHLLAAGESEEGVRHLVATLTLPNLSLRPQPLKNVRIAATVAVHVPSPTALALSEGEDDEDTLEQDVSDEMTAHELERDEVREAAKAVAKALPDRPHGFVVSKTKRGRFKLLHCIDACPLIPGVHYRDYDVWGDILPDAADIDAVCVRCLPRGVFRPPPEAESSDSASSSSGELEGPAGS